MEVALKNNLNVDAYVKGIKKDIAPFVNLKGEALADARPEINKIFNLYDGQRKTINRDLNNYILDQIKPLSTLRAKADKAHKEVEEARKLKKKVEIMNYYKDNYEEFIPQWIEVYKLIEDTRWMNKGHLTWQEDIDNLVGGVKTDIMLLEKSGYDVEDYLVDLDVDRVIEEAALIIEEVPTPEALTQVITDVNPSAPVKPGQLARRLSINVVVDDETEALLTKFLNDNKYSWVVS